MAKRSTFPPLLAVTGGEALLRTRFLRNLRETQRVAGWTVIDVDGEDAIAVRDALGGALFSDVKTLAVVENPGKVDLDLLKRHHEETDFATTLLLHVEGKPDGRTKFGQWVNKLGNMLKDFPLPNEWKAPEIAAVFVQEELRTYGFEIRPALATALVNRVSSDLGMLAFEVQKLALLAQARGTTVIDGSLIKDAMAPIAEAAVAPLAEALATRNRERLSRELVKIRSTSKYDPTIRIARLLGSSVIRWVQAAHLDALPPKAAAAELNMNPWYFETKILPPAKRWGKEGTIRLAVDLAAAERAVLRGALSPWTILTARLLAACGGGDPKPKPQKPKATPKPVVTAPKLVVPEFISKTDADAVLIPMKREWVQRATAYMQKQEELASREGVRRARGNYDRNDELNSKIVEQACEEWLRTQHGFPAIDVDFRVYTATSEVEKAKTRWAPDLDYTPFGGARIHVKFSKPADQWRDYGPVGSLNWDKKKMVRVTVAEAIAQNTVHCDKLFWGHARGCRWEWVPRWGDGAGNRLALLGESDTPDFILLGEFVRHPEGGEAVALLMCERWGRLLSNGLIERRKKDDESANAHPKASFYMANIRYFHGFSANYYDTVTRRMW